MHTLLMPLIGPMQSWGYRSRFDDRDTGLEPTRSGVIGLICAAMGIDRKESIDRFDSLRMGVRIDAPGRVMVDYHTAMDVIKASGKGKDTVVSSRHYLADARFIVGLESENLPLLLDIDSALHHPVWTISLGRKSFAPSIPVFLGDKSVLQNTSLEEALKWMPFCRLRKTEPEIPKEPLRMVLEPKAGEDTYTVQNDWPLGYENRKFSPRSVKTNWIQPEELKKGGLWPCIFQS